MPRRVGPPSRVVSFKEQGKRNLTTRKRVEGERRKRAAPLRGGRIDDVGRRIREHLNDAAPTSWSLDIGNPRKYWMRRFVLKSRGESYYNEVEDAFVAINRDKVIDSLMSDRVMSVMIRVVDPNRRGSLWFTVAATSNYERALAEVQDKLLEWAQRYGRMSDHGEEDDEATKVKELVVLVGSKR